MSLPRTDQIHLWKAYVLEDSLLKKWVGHVLLELLDMKNNNKRIKEHVQSTQTPGGSIVEKEIQNFSIL